MAWIRCMGGSGGQPSGGNANRLALTLISDTYIDGNGNEVAYGGWSSTDFADISGKSTLYTSGASGSYNAFYDSSKTFISAFTASAIVSIPNNAVYCRLSNTSASMTSVNIFTDV